MNMRKFLSFFVLCLVGLALIGCDTDNEDQKAEGDNQQNVDNNQGGNGNLDQGGDYPSQPDSEDNESQGGNNQGGENQNPPSVNPPSGPVQEIDENLLDGISPEFGLAIRLPKDGSIEIAQFADLHFNFGANTNAYHNNKADRTVAYMQSIVENQKPDLIVCSGDNLFASKGVEGVNKFIELMESFETPWTFVFGNHDAENHDKAKISDAICSAETNYLLYAEDLIVDASKDEMAYGRYGKFSIKVVNNAGDKLVGAIICMDTGTRSTVYNEYQGITAEQVAWYNEEISELQDVYAAQSDNALEVIPTMLFQHIQLPETATAFDEAKKGNSEYSFVIDQDLSGYYTDLDNLNKVKKGASAYDNGLYEKMVELGSTKAAFFGHEHIYNFQVKTAEGIVLGFGPQTGFSTTFVDNDKDRSTYIYSFDSSFNFTTEKVAEQVEEPEGLTYSYLSISNEADRVLFDYDKSTNTYTVTVKDVVQWGRFRFRLNGVLLSSETTTITGNYSANGIDNTSNLYQEADKTQFFKGNAKVQDYVFTYNAATNTLNIEAVEKEVEIPTGGLKYSKLNADALGNAVALWTNSKTFYSGSVTTSASTVQGNWMGNGWRLYVICDSEGKICYLVLEPVSGYGCPLDTHMYYYHSSYSDYKTNPAFTLHPEFKGWVPGGKGEWNAYDVQIPTGGFAITEHTDDYGDLTVLKALGVDLSGVTGKDLLEKVNNPKLLSDSIRISYDTTSKTINFTTE